MSRMRAGVGQPTDREVVDAGRGIRGRHLQGESAGRLDLDALPVARIASTVARSSSTDMLSHMMNLRPHRSLVPAPYGRRHLHLHRRRKVLPRTAAS